MFVILTLTFSIVTMLKHLERLLTNYAVPIAFINGDK